MKTNNGCNTLVIVYNVLFVSPLEPLEFSDHAICDKYASICILRLTNERPKINDVLSLVNPKIVEGCLVYMHLYTRGIMSPNFKVLLLILSCYSRDSGSKVQLLITYVVTKLRRVMWVQNSTTCE